MDRNLEYSAERLIQVCRVMSQGAERVLTRLEEHLENFRAGRAEVEEALSRLQEKRANFIRETSAAVADETCQLLDSLAVRMEELLSDGPFNETALAAPAAAEVQIVNLPESLEPESQTDHQKPLEPEIPANASKPPVQETQVGHHQLQESETQVDHQKPLEPEIQANASKPPVQEMQAGHHQPQERKTQTDHHKSPQN